MNHDPNKRGNGLALLPFLIFIAIYLGAGLILQARGEAMAFYQFPSVTAMFIAVLAAFCMGKGTIDEKFSVFARGAANENVLTMLMIYILAGAFSTVAKAMGGVDSTVNLGLSIVPVPLLAVGVFIISAFMGTATGTSMGTITAIVPIAVGVAEKSGLSIPLLLGACVGGAMFGDNLSMISDTTIAATRTQGCGTSSGSTSSSPCPLRSSPPWSCWWWGGRRPPPRWPTCPSASLRCCPMWRCWAWRWRGSTCF